MHSLHCELYQLSPKCTVSLSLLTQSMVCHYDFSHSRYSTSLPVSHTHVLIFNKKVCSARFTVCLFLKTTCPTIHAHILPKVDFVLTKILLFICLMRFSFSLQFIEKKKKQKKNIVLVYNESISNQDKMLNSFQPQQYGYSNISYNFCLKIPSSLV